MKKLFVVLLLAIATPLVVVGQVNVIHVNDPAARPAGSGVYYALPRTVLQIDVVVSAEERLKGPLSEFAERYLGITDAIRFDNTFYSISDIFITPLIEPDPDELYYVEMGQRDSRDPRSLLIEIDDNGFLVAANTIDNQTRRAPRGTRQTVMIDGMSYAASDAGDFIHTGRITPTVDTILRRVAVDTILTEQMHFRFRAIDKPAQELAAGIVEKIEDIRDARFRLLTGFQETPYESGTIKYMDSELLRQERDYIDLFRGKRYTWHEHYTFYYVPGKKPEKSASTLFKFSNSAGVNYSRSGTGENIELMLEPILTGQAVEGFDSSKRPETPQNGIAYRIPGMAAVSVKNGRDDLFTGRLTINQFGTIRRLPPQKFKAEFSPQTGGIKSLMLE